MLMLKKRYRYEIYLEMNPDLQPSPLLNCLHPLTNDITRFRLGSHFLPIEKGRWTRTPRELRMCNACNKLGDEKHVLFECFLIRRDDIILENDLSRIWKQRDVFNLFGRIKATEYM